MSFSAEIQPLEETLPRVFEGDVVLAPDGVYWQIVGAYPHQKRVRLPGVPAGYPSDRVVRFDTSPYFESLPLADSPTSVPSTESVLEQVATQLGVPSFPPPEPTGGPLTPEQEAWISALRKALNLSWDKAVTVLGEKSPERREALLRRFTEQRKQETDDLVKKWEVHIAVAKTLQAIPAAALAGVIYEVVVRLLQLLTKAVGSAMGPQPQDATMEAVARYSYRGFAGYFWLQEQGAFELQGTHEQIEIRKWELCQRFVDHVDAKLQAYETSPLGLDLRVAFPARGAKFQGAELLKLREVAQARPWEAVRFRLDTEPPLYLLEALPAPERFKSGVAAPDSVEEAAPVEAAPTGDAVEAAPGPVGAVGIGLGLALTAMLLWLWRRRK